MLGKPVKAINSALKERGMKVSFTHLIAFALVQAVSQTLPVAFVFAAMAAYAPIAVLRQRAARS